MKNDYLPMSWNDMSIRGWKQCDFVYVSGDAYVDHPSFGTAIISRLLEAHGYKIGIIAQPDWKDKRSIGMLGRSELEFLVSAGNTNSMTNHCSVSRKHRKEDSCTSDDVMGKRPDYTVMMYRNLIRFAYKDVSVIIDGIEAGLYRLTHYDYRSDKLKRSVSLDSQMDLVSCGMRERSVVEIAGALGSGLDVKDITSVDGTVYKTKSLESVYGYEMLPDYEELLKNKEEYVRGFYVQYSSTDPLSGKRLVRPYGSQLFVVQNPPSKPPRQKEMGAVYDPPYMRSYHPSYEEFGGVPTTRKIRFSLISNRGCFGACSFCALTFRQGRVIQARSHESLVEEVKSLTGEPDFKGYIHDVGGPIADSRSPVCEKQLIGSVCPGCQCLFPEPCKNLRADHSGYIALLRKLRALPEVKKVSTRSGIRFDYVLAGPNQKLLREPCKFRISGQLKAALEHVVDKVLSRMERPKNSVYHQFVEGYKEMNQRLDKEQYPVPHPISSRPGSSMKEMMELAEYLRDSGYMPEQVQDFYPTPSTVPTCMYYMGYDCRIMERVYVPVSPHERTMQRTLTQYRNPRNYDSAVGALKIAGRTGLIGYDRKYLVCPRDGYRGGGTVPATGRAKETRYKATGQRSRGQKSKKTIRNIHEKKRT